MPTPPLLPLDISNFTGLNRKQLLARLQSLFGQVRPEWDDFSANHPENLLLQGMTLLAALNAGSSDERYRQQMWSTLTDRLAAIRKGRPHGFELDGRTAGSLNGYFSISSGVALANNVLIPAGTKIMANNQVYTTTSAMNITAGSLVSATDSAGNYQEQTDSVQSEGYANTVMQLVDSPVIDDTVAITAGNGTFTATNPETSAKWSSFLEMGPDSRGFMFLQDSDGRGMVVFGNGINGVIPTGTITATYRTGGGVDGQISSTGINWTVLDTIYDALGAQAFVTFTSTTATVGGTDEMSVDEAKVRGPLAIRTNKRTVNEPDFEYVATKKLGLARASLLTSEHDSAIPEDYARLYLIAYGTAYTDSGYYPPAAPTSADLTAMAALVDQDTGEYPQLMSMSLSILSYLTTSVNIKVRIYKEANYTAATVKLNITSELQKWFAVADENRVPLYNVNWGFKLLGTDGYPDYRLMWSKIFNVVNDTAGVREISAQTDNLLLNDGHFSVTLEPARFPILGSVQVFDLDNGGVEI